MSMSMEMCIRDSLYDWLDFSGYPLTPDELIEFFGEPQDRVAVESELDYSTCGLPGYENAVSYTHLMEDISIINLI